MEKQIKAFNNRIKVLQGWRFNIEDADLKSITAWYQGRLYVIKGVYQTKELTLENAEGFNISVN